MIKKIKCLQCKKELEIDTKARFKRKYCKDCSAKRKKMWDNQWRIIIFDIKEMKRFWRGRLRAELRKLGFVMIQQSVWLSPYACEDLIALLKTDLRVGKEVIYLTTKRFDGDIWLRKHYRLT